MKQLWGALLISSITTSTMAQTMNPMGPISGGGVVVTNGATNVLWVVSGPVSAANSSEHISQATAPTNTLPGSAERYLLPDTRKEIQPSSGGAAADYGLLKVAFASDATEPVTVFTPDGKAVRFRATFLALTDRSSGASYLLGQVTNCAGQIVSPTDVLYRRAFDSIDADLIYRYDKNGSCVEQFVVVNENPELPPEFKEKDLDLSFECWTEFLDQGPQSIATQTVQLRAATGSLAAVEATDLTADFGMAKVLQGGKAFGVGEETDSLPVGKAWADIQATDSVLAGSTTLKHFLIEMTDYASIKPKLAKLPKAHASLSAPAINRGSLLALQSRPMPAFASKPMVVGLSPGDPNPGMVLDFALGLSLPIPSGIVAWWKGEGNASESINGYNGSLLNGATCSAGEVGQAFLFAGGSQCMQASDGPLLNTSSAMTLECWVYINAFPACDAVLIAGKDSTSAHQYQIALCSNPGRWCFRPLIMLPNGVMVLVSGYIVPEVNTWNHVAMTYDGSSLKLYVNGSFDVSVAAPGAIPATADPFLVGGYGTGPWTLNGKVDEVSLYNRALSETEIQDIYNVGAAGKGGSPTCISAPANQIGWWPGNNGVDLAKGHYARPYAGASYAPGEVGGGFSFDGVNAYAEVGNNPDLNPTTGLTLEAWVYQTGQQYQNMPIMSKDGCYANRQYFLTIASSGKFRAHVGTDRLYYFDGTTSVQLNTWYHVAMTYDGSALKLYVNGVQEGTAAVTGNIISTSEPFVPLRGNS